jgi:hypothetical protein
MKAMGSTEMTWPPHSHDGYDRLNGSDVYSQDDMRLGKVVQIYHPREEMPRAQGEHIFRIQPDPVSNPFGASEAYIPEPAIESPRGDGLTLTLPADQVASQQWDTRPASLADFHPSDALD